MSFDAPPPSPAAPSSEERTPAVLAHALAILASFIAPLVVLLTAGNTSAFARRAAVESLNFQITLAIGWVVAWLGSIILIGLLLMPILGIAGLVLPIIAAVRANAGEDYKYPFSLRLVK